MLWFFSTLVSMVIIVYILWAILQRLIDGTINAIDDLQNLTEEALQAEMDIISQNIPPLAKLFWGINSNASNLLDRLNDIIRPRLIQLRDQVLNTLLIIIISGILLFLIAITIHFRVLALFLSVLFPCLAVSMHVQDRRQGL